MCLFILLCGSGFQSGLWSGIVSGIVVSIFIWATNICIRNIKYIDMRYPVVFDKEKIEVFNTGLRNINNLSIKCQVTFTNFLPNNLHKIVKYNIPIENSDSYISPELKKQYTVSEFLQYHILKSESVRYISGTSYQFQIQDMVSSPKLPDNVRSLQDFIVRYRNIHLRFYISYRGPLSGIEKTIIRVYTFDNNGNPVLVE